MITKIFPEIEFANGKAATRLRLLGSDNNYYYTNIICEKGSLRSDNDFLNFFLMTAYKAILFSIPHPLTTDIAGKHLFEKCESNETERERILKEP